MNSPPLSMDAAGWDRRYSNTAGVWGDAPNVWVTEELNGLTPGRALDLGTGEGRHAIWLAGRGWKVQAVDFAAVGLDTGKRRADAEGVGDLITWTVEDASRIRPAPQTLDLVLVAYLQLPEVLLRPAVTAAAAALAPGGTFLFVSHDVANPMHGTGGPQDPGVLQSPEQVAGWLREKGLAILSSGTKLRPVSGAPRPALDCVVLAGAPGAAADSWRSTHEGQRRTSSSL